MTATSRTRAVGLLAGDHDVSLVDPCATKRSRGVVFSQTKARLACAVGYFDVHGSLLRGAGSPDPSHQSSSNSSVVMGGASLRVTRRLGSGRVSETLPFDVALQRGRAGHQRSHRR